MIDVDERDIFVARRTADGRFLLFTSTDVRPEWPLRWWIVVVDTGGDGIGLPVRFDPSAAPDGWTARQLFQVVLARADAECRRASDPLSRLVLRHLHLAANGLDNFGPTAASEDPVTFELGDAASPYPWTVARCGGLTLQLCPEPSSRDEGVTPEQLLIILEQLLSNTIRRPFATPALRDSRLRISAALAAEIRRVAAARGGPERPRLSD